MNYKRLETFVWVASLGNFRKAAERLHTTQPAISARISGLEDELGVKLFEREGGSSPIILTSKGKELLPYVEKILYQTEQLRKRAGLSTAHSGVLRLGVSETIVNTWLPDFLARLHKDMPNLDVEMTVDITANLTHAIKDRTLDLGLLMGPISEPNIVNRALCTFSLSWVASPRLELPERLLYLEELAKWPIITYARATKPYVEINQKFRELDGPPTHFFASTSLAACRSLAIDAVGISTLPNIMIAKELDNGSLRKLHAVWTPSDLTFTASYSSDPFNPLADAAVELAIAAAKEYEQKLA
ncbi:LysR family transcriptional regulator [Marinomonas sp. M1K-6]|uniref:LysR family transcriptional regulator n=1 Tax=Marinomonas profundi TaxID=2726122 RepID=A0A847R5L1_9GAMM|nr:LysR family transcriptional regulator [Marinomonas profundi]NLQ17803.1 LysR family transcriptional regulator [Marinomonas profundi]UDV04358.1 LysR family transcriptional regulator [Marinomonas profundi]